MTTTATALNQDTAQPRNPAWALIHNLRTTARLTWCWIELWPLSLAIASTAGPLTTLSPPTPGQWAGLLFAIVVTIKYWRTGAYTKNVTDTLAITAERRWRRLELADPTIPHLIHIQVTGRLPWRDTWRILRIEGPRAIPAQLMTITVRPTLTAKNDDQFRDWLENWARRRYGYQSSRAGVSHVSANLIDVTLTQRTIPDHVPTIDDLDEDQS